MRENSGISTLGRNTSQKHVEALDWSKLIWYGVNVTNHKAVRQNQLIGLNFSLSNVKANKL